MIIFGLKGYQTLLGVVTLVCGFCHTPAAQRVERLTNKFTLFFVPLFAVSTKHVLQCAMCGARSPLGAQEAEQLAAGTGPWAGPFPEGAAPHLRKGQQGGF